MTSDPGNIPLYWFIIVAALILNFLVIMANSAFDSVSINKVRTMTEDDEEKKSRVEKLSDLLERSSRYAYTNRLISYTLVILAFGVAWFGLGFDPVISAAVMIVVLLSVGEFLPRKIAVQHAERIALAFTGIQSFICIIMTPFVWILVMISNLFLKIFRQNINVDNGEFSEEEVMSMLEVGQETGVIKEEGKKMINSIFEFDDELAYEIMTPRTDVFMIDITDPVEDYIDQLMELRYSRIPVCENDTDNVIGILHIKDFLIKAREEGFENVDINSILRKAYFVPETKNIDSLFFELQKSKQHIAILIDEYGGFSGIVTMEDIIEEVMGDIDDEYDEEVHIIEKIDDSTYMVDGDVSLDDLDEELEIGLESENSETIGGFLIDILGEIPEESDIGRAVEFENFLFTIESVKDRRIEKIKLEILPENNGEQDETVKNDTEN